MNRLGVVEVVKVVIRVLCPLALACPRVPFVIWKAIFQSKSDAVEQEAKPLLSLLPLLWPVRRQLASNFCAKVEQSARLPLSRSETGLWNVRH